VGLRRARVRAWLDVAVLWAAWGELPALVRAAEGLPEGDELRGSVAGVRGAIGWQRTKDLVEARAAAERFEAAAKAGTGAARSAAFNNAGVMRSALGETEVARGHYRSALALDSAAAAASYNLAALSMKTEGKVRLEDVVGLAAAAKAEAAPVVRLHALALRHAVAASDKAEAARQEFVAGLAAAREATPYAAARTGEFNYLTTSGEWRLTTRYAGGLEIVDESAATTWLVDPAPGLAGLIAGAGKAK
jgi:hypothetical protein